MVGDRGILAFGDVVEQAPEVRPAIGQGHGPARSCRIGECVVAGIAVDLQDTGEPGQVAQSVLAAAAGRVDVNDRRRISAAPRPVIASDRPQIPGLGPTATGIEHRGPRLVAEQLGRALQQLQHAMSHRRQQERAAAHPQGEVGAVDVDALAGQDLPLAIKRQVVGVLV